MRWRWTAVLLLWSVLGGVAWAAPRPLSQPHAHLDDSDRCNSCHVAFGGVPAERCLGCHRDIDQRLQAQRGFHGKAALNLRCNDCHREHLGRQHELTPLDRATFDHDQTGWPLQGGHRGVECRRCHTAKRPGTGRDSYLNPEKTCRGCHGEYHGTPAGKVRLNECDACHTTFEWTKRQDPMRFDHERETRFPRTGKHLKVECEKCHLDKKSFGPIQVAGCVTCHRDPHPPGAFGARICEECHVTRDFKDVALFDHGSTGWPLKGKHREQKCADCHEFPRWKPRTSECAGCHEDVHRGQFRGVSCGRCHEESSWTKLSFDHDAMSRFPLKGQHRKVDCGKCHKDGHYKPIDPACKNCHAGANPHGTTFGDTPCSNCHAPTGWLDTRFDHGVTGFPLAGKHVEQPCFRCHPNGTEVEDDTIAECVFCHRDVHAGQFQGASCDRCHAGFERWRIPFFDHTLSRFQLVGKHIEVRCEACHKQGHYRPIDTACGNCHLNFHDGQFAKPCDECHSPHGWTLVQFDHDRQSEFALYGEHRGLDCKKCHVDNDYKGLPFDCAGCHVDEHKGRRGPACDRCHTAADWSTNQARNHDFGAFTLGGVHDLLACETCHGPERRRELAGTGPECINCHRDPHFGSLGPLCLDCHTQQHFLPSTFLHVETGFRLSGAHRFVECRDCHPGRVYGGLPSTCDFCHTDSFQQTAARPDCDHTQHCPGGLATCHTCHTTQAFVPARPGTNCGPCESSR